MRIENKNFKAKYNSGKARVVNTAENPIARRILARNVYVDNNTFFTHINNNDLLAGASGAGKTRHYIIPNLLHTDENLIIADTKGNLYALYGDYLRKKGYNVLCVDFTDIDHSPCGYNPLDYVRKNDVPELINRGDIYNEGDVKKIASAICPIQNNDDPFWDLMTQMYLELFLMYMLKTYPKNKRNLCEVYSMLCIMGTKEFKEILGEEAAAHPRSAIAKKFRMIMQNEKAEKMHSCIIGILAQHLDVVSYSNTERLFTMKNRVDLSAFVNQKTVLFLNVSDNDRSNDMLVNCFYTQAFQYLINAAAKRPDSRLPIPVRFLLDDFSTNTVIPDFDNLISVIRSREICVSLVVQSLSQLEALYGHEKAMTIINNCDHCLYLGGTDVETAQYFAQKLDCQTSTVLNLPLESAFLFERGKRPVKVEKYDLEADEIYNGLKRQCAVPGCNAANSRLIQSGERSA